MFSLSLGRGPAKASEERPWAINLWAPPGFGKSRTSAGVFNHLKAMYKPVEQVHEVAKFLTYEGNELARSCPFYVTALQEYSQYILKGKVEYLVTDSPIGLSLQWARDDGDYDMVLQLTNHLRRRYRNIDFRLTWKPGAIFEAYGRNQTEASSKALEADLARAMSNLGIAPIMVEAGDSHSIVKHVLRHAVA